MSELKSSGLNTVLASKLDVKGCRAQANAAGIAKLLNEIRRQEAMLPEGGGSGAVDGRAFIGTDLD